MKLKLKPIKNKKVIYILFALAAVLLLGITASLVKNIGVTDDMCEVVINYNIVDKNGGITRFDTYREEYPRGEHINIASPKKEGYSPNKEKIVAVVKSDMNFTVNYTLLCTHENVFSSGDSYYLCNEDYCYYDYEECYDCGKRLSFYEQPHDFTVQVEQYPSSGTPGIMLYYCSICGYEREEEFTSISRTFEFGGSDVSNLADLGLVGENVNGYQIPLVNEKNLVLLKENLPELDVIFDGIVNFDGKSGLSDAATVTFSYDKEAWNNAEIIYKKDPAVPTVNNAHYSFRFGKDWRVVFGIEGLSSGVMSDFVFDDSCPLITSPITITLTYDFTK